jgi:hypothetical protein
LHLPIAQLSDLWVLRRDERLIPKIFSLGFVSNKFTLYVAMSLPITAKASGSLKPEYALSQIFVNESTFTTDQSNKRNPDPGGTRRIQRLSDI